MEILNKNVALLSNSEVYALLKQTKENLAHKLMKKKSAKNPDNVNLEINVDKHLSTVVYESLRYLEKTPCVNQSPYIVTEFLRKCEENASNLKLTKVEKLQLLNHRPSTSVELQYLIEDSEERFTLEQMEELLEFVQNNLPSLIRTESIEDAEPATSSELDPSSHT